MFEPYYQEDCFFLYHGSCLDILESLPENSVNMIFADPPYNLSNGGFSVHSGRRVDVHKGDWDKSSGADEDFAFHLSWIKACHRVLKPEGNHLDQRDLSLYLSVWLCFANFGLQDFK